jgi:hypothetical protein
MVRGRLGSVGFGIAKIIRRGSHLRGQCVRALVWRLCLTKRARQFREDEERVLVCHDQRSTHGTRRPAARSLVHRGRT